jgi:ABC-type oligopeptide transport system substrate-binding subunit
VQRENAVGLSGFLRRCALICALAGVSTGLVSAAEAGVPAPPRAMNPGVWTPRTRTTGLNRLDSRLTRIAAAHGRVHAMDRGKPGIDGTGGDVRVVLETTDADAAKAAVTAAGGRVETTYAQLVQAIVPPAALQSLSHSAGVRFVRPPLRPQPESVTSEGVGTSGASAWQAAGRNGAGVKIGIIDVGFAGYTDRVAEGELPGSVTTVDFCDGGLTTATDHGTAVAEIVHDVAPAAQLYLICIRTDVELGNAEQYAKTHGIKIVNHSVAWFNSSRGDGSGGPGTPDAVVADARANGILWVNAAGNYADLHWSGPFKPDPRPGLSQWNLFAPNDNIEGFDIVGGGVGCLSLKWDNWPVSKQDFDLVLFDVDRFGNLEALAASENEQYPAGGRPTEDLCWQNTVPGPGKHFYVAIYSFHSTVKPRLDLFAYGDVFDQGFGFDQKVAAGSIVEPASSPNALAVGAVCAKDGSLEFYSSLGPTIGGKVKPDISGPDSVSTATYGPFDPHPYPKGCAHSGFTGTSASAPHVAGAAALVAERYPDYTAAQLQAFLEGKAQDLGRSGKDTSFGAGKLSLPGIVAPSVRVTPASGTVGSTVTINGSGFTGVTAVRFNGTPSTSVTNVTETSLRAVVPDGAQTGPVQVVSPDGTGTSTASFTVTPRVTGFTPSAAKRGAAVTIHGSNFTGAQKVVFGSAAILAPGFTVADDGTITTTVPMNAVTGKVTVTTLAGSAASATPFTVFQQPRITGLSPSAGPVGTLVTASGTGLDVVTSATVGGVTAAFQHVSAGQIKVTVPPTASTGAIAVDGPGGAGISPNAFKVSPQVTGFSPSSARYGDPVEIDGSNFTGATKVLFGSVVQPVFTVVDDATIATTVPAKAISAKVTVTTQYGSGASTGAVVVILPPTISSFSPSAGPVGTTVTVKGTRMDAVTGAQVGGANVVDLTHVSAAQLKIDVPPGAATAKITLTDGVDPAVDSANQFKVSPTVAGFSPASARPGEPLEIDGSNFTGASKVSIGSVTAPASTFTELHDDRIVLPVPAAATSGKVTVTTLAGSGTGAGTLVVILPPKLSSFSPASGPVGTTVTVNGTHLDAVTGAKVNGVGVVDPLVHVGTTKLQIVVPPGAATGKIALDDASDPAVESGSDFKVTPKVTGFSPSSARYGDPVEIDGSNFTGATKVLFGSVVQPAFTVVDDTTIATTVPAKAISAKVTVTTPYGSGASTGAFVVALTPAISSLSPASGPQGTVVTVNGSGLDGVTSASVGGTGASILHVSPSQIRVTVPAGAVTGPIGVSGFGGTATSVAPFKVTPKITTFTPASGPRGAAVELDGSGFTGATKVLFGSVAATSLSVDSDGKITTTIPPTAVTGKITVTTPSGSNVSVGTFTVAAAAPKVLRVNLSSTDVDFVDPALAYFAPSWQLLHSVCANLVNYPDAALPDGALLQPEVATSLPDISPDGKTYTFTLRHDYRFAPPSNQPVTPQSFKDEIDRLASPSSHSPAAPFISVIQGVAAVQAGAASTVSGVVASGDTLTITLTKPAEHFLSLLALPWFCAVPAGTPITAQGVDSFASAGPYSVVSRTPGGPIVLRRNPYYVGERPVTFDEIDYAVALEAEQSRQQVEAGSADFAAGGVPPADVNALYSQYGPGSAAAAAGRQQLFVHPMLETDYLALNTSRGPFADPRLRKAVNFALDRPALIAQRSPHAATATDQFLPPGIPGFRDADLYPLTGPDLTAAQAVLPSGFTGADAVMYTSSGGVGPLIGQVVKANLEAIGIHVTVQQFSAATLNAKCGTRTEAFDICVAGWSADYADPQSFLQLLDGATIEDTGNNNLSYFDDSTFNGRIADAELLTGAARHTAFGDLDVDIARDAAPLAPIDNRNSLDFFSERVGCQIYQPIFGMDVTALCLR